MARAGIPSVLSAILEIATAMFWNQLSLLELCEERCVPLSTCKDIWILTAILEVHYRSPLGCVAVNINQTRTGSLCFT